MVFETFDQSDEKTSPDQNRLTYLLTYQPYLLPTFLPKGTIVQTFPEGLPIQTVTLTSSTQIVVKLWIS